MLAAVIALNILFVLLHYISDEVPKDHVSKQLEHGFLHGDLVNEHYPALKHGTINIAATVGLDQYTDCFIYLMSLHNERDRWRNAVNPRILTHKGMSLCKAVYMYSSVKK